MGKYDNFSNEAAIAAAEARLNKISRKRKIDPYQISLAVEGLNRAKIFQRCQAFTANSAAAPNGRVLFNDDTKVMLFIDRVIPYEDIQSYRILENTYYEEGWDTSMWDVLASAHFGRKIAGDFGAIVFAQARADSAQTTYTQRQDGFIFQIILKNGEAWQCKVPNHGIIWQKIHPKWLELGTKIQRIIDGTND